MNYFSFSVDPVDGTMNFVHSFPYSCISLAVAFKKEVHIGIIYKYIKNSTTNFHVLYIIDTYAVLCWIKCIQLVWERELSSIMSLSMSLNNQVSTGKNSI